MNYSASFQYVFKNPNWFVNCLLGAVCMLIPVVGPFLWLGYCFEVLVYLHHGKQSRGAYPDFDFNNFVPYLIRGLWIFLSHLMISLPITIIASVPAAILGLIAAFFPDNSVVVLLVVLLLVLLMLGIMAGSLIIAPSVILRGGLTQKFELLFSVPFYKDFVSKMWKECLLGGLFLTFTGFAVGIVGLLAFCVGVYVAHAFISLVQMHIYYQLYELYLQRGGEPIPETTSSQ